jgi:[acyl-carrier-protein] S-malonyltransferase
VMAEALAAVPILAPSVPVVVNVRAEAVTEPDRIKDLLVAQVTGSVRWRESILWMERAGVTEYWEIGAGKALSGMIKRIASGAVTRAIGTPDDIAAAKPE